MNNIYPWQQRQWDIWTGLVRNNQPPHALLLYGNPGIGIRDFALRAAQSILCECSEIEQKPCGSCRACHLIEAATHPDYLLIEAQKNEVQIDQVQQLIKFLQLERQYQQYRVVVVPELDKLNHSAANALLKILEEPPPWSLILAGTEYLSRLLATIRSRCQKIRFPLPGEEARAWLAGQLQCDKEQARRKLEQHNMQVLTALEESTENENYESFHRDFVSYISGEKSFTDMVESWQNTSPERLQNWLLKELHDILKSRFQQKDGQFGLATAHLKSEHLENLYLLQVGRCHLSQANLNARLLLESSLLEWGRALRAPAG